MGEHFCLRWNNHQSTVVSVVESLLNSDSLTDCTLAAEGKYLKAHKLILTACSPYFEALLCQHHDKHPIFILKDVKYYELKAMLDYMYKGEVNISQDQLDSFIKTAESLQIKGLTDQGGGGNSNSIGETDSRDVGSTPKRKPLHARPDSPPAGAAPAREGSPTIKRRRRVGSGAAATGLGHHLDEAPTPGVPPVDPSRLAAVIPKTEPPDPHHPVGPPPQPPPQQPPQPQSQLSSSSALPPVKSEVFDDTGGEEIEDLTLDDDDDEDYRGGGGDTSQPGTSFEGNSQASQDYTQWQMTGDRSTDEVFMAAQEAINSQTNSQGGFWGDGKSLVEVILETHSQDTGSGLPTATKTTPRRLVKVSCDPEEQRFPCTTCGRSYKHYFHLKAHRRECSVEPMFKCELCQKSFFQSRNLDRHMIQVHKKTSVPKKYFKESSADKIPSAIVKWKMKQKAQLNKENYLTVPEQNEQSELSRRTRSSLGSV